MRMPCHSGSITPGAEVRAGTIPEVGRRNERPACENVLMENPAQMTCATAISCSPITGVVQGPELADHAFAMLAVSGRASAPLLGDKQNETWNSGNLHLIECA